MVTTVIQRPIGDQPGDWLMFNETPTSVSLVRSVLNVETAEDGTVKREFITNQRDILSMKTGNLEAYRYERYTQGGKTKHKMRNVTRDLLHVGPYISPAHLGLYREVYKLAPEWMIPKDRDPSQVAQLAYPMLRVRPEWRQFASDYDLHKLLKHDNAKEFTTAIYGAEEYRKDLMKAVSDSHLEAVLTAKQFQGLVPIDWITAFLNGVPGPGTRRSALSSGPSEIKKLKPLIRRLPEKVRRALLTNTQNFERRQLEYADAVGYEFEQLRRRNPGRKYEFSDELKTWTEVYERTRIIERDLRNRPRRIPQTAYAKAVHKTQPLKGYELQTAQKTTEMTKWGDEMAHCIGGYTDNAVRGDRTYLALLKDGKLHANIEIRDNGYVGQFYGKHNRSIESWLERGITDFIQQKTLAHQGTNSYAGYLEKAKLQVMTDKERAEAEAKAKAEAEAKRAEEVKARAAEIAANAAIDISQFTVVARETAELIENTIHHFLDLQDQERGRLQQAARVQDQGLRAWVNHREAQEGVIDRQMAAHVAAAPNGGLVQGNRIEIIGVDENAVQNRIVDANRWNAPGLQPLVAQMFAQWF